MSFEERILNSFDSKEVELYGESAVRDLANKLMEYCDYEIDRIEESVKVFEDWSQSGDVRASLIAADICVIVALSLDSLEQYSDSYKWYSRGHVCAHRVLFKDGKFNRNENFSLILTALDLNDTCQYGAAVYAYLCQDYQYAMDLIDRMSENGRESREKAFYALCIFRLAMKEDRARTDSENQKIKENLSDVFSEDSKYLSSSKLGEARPIDQHLFAHTAIVYSGTLERSEGIRLLLRTVGAVRDENAQSVLEEALKRR